MQFPRLCFQEDISQDLCKFKHIGNILKCELHVSQKKNLYITLRIQKMFTYVPKITQTSFVFLTWSCEGAMIIFIL